MASPTSKNNGGSAQTVTFFFKRCLIQIVSCPNCQTSQVHPEKDGIVQWEKDHAAPRRSQLTSVKRRHFFSPTTDLIETAFQFFFSWWQPYQAKIERFFVTTLAKFTLHIHSRREKGSSLSGTWHLQIFRNQ